MAQEFQGNNRESRRSLRDWSSGLRGIQRKMQESVGDGVLGPFEILNAEIILA